jgi:hypothetical protein
MSDRVYASVFYIALIVGSSWVAVTVGESLTRQALSQLTFLPSSYGRPSRVDTYLAAQERPDEPLATTRLLVPAVPAITIGALAKALDDAEQSEDVQADEAAADDVPKQAASSPSVAEKADKPRVAGWVKRAPKPAVALSTHEETSNRLIMRSLRAEM